MRIITAECFGSSARADSTAETSDMAAAAGLGSAHERSVDKRRCSRVQASRIDAPQVHVEMTGHTCRDRGQQQGTHAQKQDGSRGGTGGSISTSGSNIEGESEGKSRSSRAPSTAAPHALHTTPQDDACASSRDTQRAQQQAKP